MRKSLNFLPLILIALLYLTVGFAQAQTPEPAATPTLAVTPDAIATTAPEVETPVATDAAPVIVVDTDNGTVTIPVDIEPEPLPDVQNGMWAVMPAIVVSVLVVLAAALGVSINGLLNSVPGKMLATILANIAPRTETPVDDLVLKTFLDSGNFKLVMRPDGWRELVPVEAVDASVGAQITAAFDNERQKLREGLHAQAANRDLAFGIVPPDKPANG
jgi:hypothetical protein